MKWAMKRIGLSLALGALFLVSLGLQALTHDGTATEFWNAVMENWQSEFLQLLTFVVLSKYLIHEGSPQSKDGMDSVQNDIKDIKATLLRNELYGRRD